MIRIVDEPIFSMTQEELDILVEEYSAINDGEAYNGFEDWLRRGKRLPHTTWREQNP